MKAANPANPLPVIDLHEDITMYYLGFGAGEPLDDYNVDLPGRNADIPKYMKGNVRVVFASIFPGTTTFNLKAVKEGLKRNSRRITDTIMRYPQTKLFEHFRVLYMLSEAYGIKILESFNDVEEVLNAETFKLGFIIHLEGAEALDDPYDLKLLKKLGLRSLGLTWNYNNRWGSSCTSRKDYGLTPDGEELVKVANEEGVLIDLAHASKRTAIEAIEASKKPVIVSHANVKSVHNHPRNVDDDVLEALHKCGGVIGVTAVSSFITSKPKATIEDLINHVLYIYERFGSHILGIGTDFHGLLGSSPPEGFESVDRVQHLLTLLSEKGLGDNDLRNIAYGNVMRVLKAVFT